MPQTTWYEFCRILQGTTCRSNLKISGTETALTPQLTPNLPSGQSTFRPETLLSAQKPPDQ